MILRHHRSLLIAAALVIMSLLLLIGPASAHEGRTIGDYDVAFGWRSEPALVGYLNGPELFIAPQGTDPEEGGSAMEGVDVSLQVEVSFGPATKTLDMEPAEGEAGHYIADLIPSRPGDYSFHLTGTIGDTQVDETFTSADGQFSSVEPASDITFPDEQPSIVELLDRIAQLEARVTALEGGS